MEVSVIVPFYNSALYIKEAVQSIIKQSFDSLEIIAVNDGSTDDSVKILETINDPRLRIIDQPNAGAAAARNLGVKQSGGKYLAFLDADDLWVPEKIEIQYKAILENPGMIFSHVKEFMGTDISNATSEAVPGLSAITLLISKEDFLKAGWFDPQWTVAEFIDWYDRAKAAGINSLLLPGVLAYRRVHAGNTDRLKRPDVKQYASVLKATLDRRRALN